MWVFINEQLIIQDWDMTWRYYWSHRCPEREFLVSQIVPSVYLFIKILIDQQKLKMNVNHGNVNEWRNFIFLHLSTCLLHTFSPFLTHPSFFYIFLSLKTLINKELSPHLQDRVPRLDSTSFYRPDWEIRPISVGQGIEVGFNPLQDFHCVVQGNTETKHPP